MTAPRQWSGSAEQHELARAALLEAVGLAEAGATLPCVSASVARALPLPCVSAASVKKTLPFPCVVPLPPRLRYCLCLSLAVHRHRGRRRPVGAGRARGGGAQQPFLARSRFLFATALSCSAFRCVSTGADCVVASFFLPLADGAHCGRRRAGLYCKTGRSADLIVHRIARHAAPTAELSTWGWAGGFERDEGESAIGSGLTACRGRPQACVAHLTAWVAAVDLGWAARRQRTTAQRAVTALDGCSRLPDTPLF